MFADTIIICTLTAMVVLCSGVPITYGEAAGTVFKLVKEHLNEK